MSIEGVKWMQNGLEVYRGLDVVARFENRDDARVAAVVPEALALLKRHAEGWRVDREEAEEILRRAGVLK